MQQILLTFFLVSISVTVYAEVNENGGNQLNSVYLDAPGTVSGLSDRDKQQKTESEPHFTFPELTFNASRNRYKYVGESRKFRQFGQYPGQNNPWYQDFNMGYPQNLNISTQHPITNPWQLNGMPHLYDLQAKDQSNSAGGFPRQFDGSYPDYPDSIYRDANPAVFAIPARSKSIMPDFGGDNFNFPFSPFGMF